MSRDALGVGGAHPRRLVAQPQQQLLVERLRASAVALLAVDSTRASVCAAEPARAALGTPARARTLSWAMAELRRARDPLHRPPLRARAARARERARPHRRRGRAPGARARARRGGRRQRAAPVDRAPPGGGPARRSRGSPRAAGPSRIWTTPLELVPQRGRAARAPRRRAAAGARRRPAPGARALLPPGRPRGDRPAPGPRDRARRAPPTARWTSAPSARAGPRARRAGA